MDAAIRFFLDQARAGDSESAFHGLRELGVSCLPEIQSAYRSEPDSQIRAFILSVVREWRSPSSVGFLAEAIQESSPDVWKAALDGLVTLASAEAALELESAICQERDDLRREWLREAWDQAIDDCLLKGHPSP